ncbi:autotransporter domain-containing protein [Bradyrhizobium prioriisuperbiae]|uniref:autotransporter domain-containing protein n=1 Tax=Bradyrhizobium prioriisuperbiae TaxID=2854389 RepID=UPI0028E87C9C|nr:autotransporter domain-containing protein [Bradyrhizobium prioritasuperba]
METTVLEKRVCAKRRALLTCMIAVSAIVAVPAPLQAQSQFTSVTAFGDSFADHGLNILPLFAGDKSNYPSHGGDLANLNRTAPLGYVGFPYPLQSKLGLANNQLTNYAVGGATTSDYNIALPGAGLSYQLNAWGGRPFGNRDLVTIHIGLNDLASPLEQGLPVPSGIEAGANAAAAVRRFVQAGARTIAFVGFSDASRAPIFDARFGPPLYPGFGPAAGPAAQKFSANYYATLQQQMRPLSQAGARIFLFDETRLIDRVAANPRAYGLESAAYVPGLKSLFIYDNVHWSTEGFALTASYLVNLLRAPSTYPAQADVAHIAATGFGRLIFSQLDSSRSAGFGATNATMAMMTNMPASTFAPVNPISIYLGATGVAGKTTNLTDALGMRYGMGGGQIGAEYRLTPNVKLGAVFNFSTGEFSLRQGGGKIDQDAYQYGAYASFSYSRWFTDVMALYSRGNLKIERPGVIDTVYGDTKSDSFAIGVRAAYLFDVMPRMQVGPLAGLTYARTSVRGFAETGDPLLTFEVGGQKLDSLTGSAGVQLRFPLMINNQPLSPYVNLTAEHDFCGGGPTILATLTQSPLLSIYTPVPGRGGETYGAVQAGLSAAFSDQATVALGAATIFARSSGNDYGGNIALKYRF